MGELMINNIKSILLPNKKINIFVIVILFLGIVLGAIFANLISLNDKNLVIDKIQLFISNINTNSFKRLILLKTSLSINFTYIFIIWLLGMSIIGIIFNIFLLFIKGFIFSFTATSFILGYGYKGIMLSFLYLVFGQLLNIIVIMVLAVYSISFSCNLLKIIFKNNNNSMHKYLKNYILILLFMIIISIISSLSESFLLPALIKLIIKLFI